MQSLPFTYHAYLHRNIIEKNHSDLVAGRKCQSLHEDENLLKAFNSTKEDSWRGEREHGQRLNLGIQQQQAIRVIVILCVIVAVLVVVLAAVSSVSFAGVYYVYTSSLTSMQLMFVGGAVWAWSGASGEYMRKPVAEWSNSDVVEWVRGLGQWTQPNITQLFIKEVFDGLIHAASCSYIIPGALVTGHHGISTAKGRQNHSVQFWNSYRV